jgi:hypothetical protein
MKSYKQLVEERSQIRTQQSKINDCESIFAEYDKEPYTEEFWLAINLVLKQLKEKEEEINVEMGALAKICEEKGEHDLKYVGHTSHEDIYRCEICGF